MPGMTPRGARGPGTRARAGRLGGARGPAGRARARPGSCARDPARPWAAPLRRPGGGSRLLPGRRHALRRVAGRQAARVGGGVAPGAAALGGAARERGMPDPEACAAGGGRARRRALRGRGPGPADRRGVRPRPWGPWARERPSRPTASVGTPGCPPALACRATTRRPRGRPCAASSAWRCATRARPEGFLARLGGSRRGGSATTSTGSCGTSRRGGRAPTGRTPCRARRRRGATTTRGSPSRGSRSPSGPTGRISWPCQRWSNRELANLRTLLCLHVCPQRCSSVHE